MNMREILFSSDPYSGVESTLRANPELARQEIPLPDNPVTALPLHRICDGVFNGIFTEQLGVALAQLFLKYGAEVNTSADLKDSPLTAACSLRCDRLAQLYIEHGARTDHRGCHGGTALHWASWCGRDVVVRRLLQLDPDINELCVDFKATPLFWAIHGYKFGGPDNRHHQVDCARLLLQHGADPEISNKDGTLAFQLLNSDDKELLKLFELR